jgi:hypothetical protein
VGEHAIGVQLHRLVSGIVDLGYWRAFDRWSAGALVAFGAGAADDAQVQSRTLGLGVQGLWHAWGSASRGLHLGVEWRWEHRANHRDEGQTFDNNTMQSVAVPAQEHTSRGTHLGALVGARWTWPAGLWVQGQLGVRQLWTSDQLDCCNLPAQTSSASGVRSLAGITAGWTF